MDKHTISTLAWFGFVICFFLSCWSMAKAYADGEVSRSRAGGVHARIIRRDDDPSGFQRYMLALVVMNVVFLVGLIVWGIALFVW